MLIVLDISTNDTEVMEKAIESISDMLSKKYKGVKVVGSAYSPRKKEKKSVAVPIPNACDIAETLPLLGGGEHHVTFDEIAIYADAYPALDPLAEIKKAKVWLNDNPKLKKTASGIRRFVNSWLARAQDSAVRQPQGNSKNIQPEGYNSFETEEFFAAAVEAGKKKYGASGT